MIYVRPRIVSNRRCATYLTFSVFTVLVVLLGLGTGTARADIVFPECVNSPESVTVDQLTVTGEDEEWVLAGNTAVLYNSANSMPESNLPACVAGLAGDTPVTSWAYCTDFHKGTCYEPGFTPLGSITGNPKFDPSVDPLGPDKERVIAYLARNGYPIADPPSIGTTVANDDDVSTRWSLQILIWCVSEAPPGQKTSDDWYDGPGFDTACTLNFTDDDFDAVLAMLPPDPTLSVTRIGGASVPAGSTATFRITSNVVSDPIELDLPGGATMEVCGGDATLIGDTLQIGGTDDGTDREIGICVTSDSPGQVQLAASTDPSGGQAMTWVWSGDDDCQVFGSWATTDAATLSDSASVQFTAADRALDTGRLKIRKVAGRKTVRPGEVITYRITVRNSSNVDLRKVKVCDRLPAGVTLVSTSPRSKGSATRRCWTLNRLRAGAKKSFKVVVRVNRATRGRVVNRADARARNSRNRPSASVSTRITMPSGNASGGVTG